MLRCLSGKKIVKKPALPKKSTSIKRSLYDIGDNFIGPLNSNFIEIAFRHGCSPVNLQHIFRISFRKNTSGRLLLDVGMIEVESPLNN